MKQRRSSLRWLLLCITLTNLATGTLYASALPIDDEQQDRIDELVAQLKRLLAEHDHGGKHNTNTPIEYSIE